MLLLLAIVWVAEGVSGDVFHESEYSLSFCPPFTTNAASRTSCAIHCAGQGTGCFGFSKEDGNNCTMFSTVCEPGTIKKKAHGPILSRKGINPCRHGWISSGNSCYRREKVNTGMNFEEAKQVCKAKGDHANLLTLNDPGEERWIINHSSKPNAKEHIGLQNIGGKYINVDGSSPKYTPQIDDIQTPNGGCVSVKMTATDSSLELQDCSESLNHFICEEPPQRCALQRLWPDGWYSLGGYCYLYVPSLASWSDADAHCASLKPGARLASIPDRNTFFSLQDVFNATNTNMWLGVTDRDQEGVWQSTDGSVWNLPWYPGEPTNYANEHCMGVVSSGKVADYTCNRKVNHICRVECDLCHLELN